jgi:hypothetical protein
MRMALEPEALDERERLRETSTVTGRPARLLCTVGQR